MNLPEIPDRGISKRGRAFIKECLAYMRATTPVAGAGISLRELAGGTQINAAGGGGAGNLIFTFCQNGILERFSLVGRSLGPVGPDA